MRLAAENAVVELRIAGYEYPHLTNAQYDSNWLFIEGLVAVPRGVWAFRAPCLLTYEARALGHWLEAVSEGCDVQPRFNFTEPNVSFGMAVQDGQRVLKVFFKLESRPPWKERGEAEVADLPVAELDLEAAVRDWQEQLQAFPQRTDR